MSDWAQGKPAAFDITFHVSSYITAMYASMCMGGSAAEGAYHTANNRNYVGICVPLAVESESTAITLLATCLAFCSSFHKVRVISDMFGRLAIT